MISGIAKQLLLSITPQLRGTLVEFANDFKARAAKTSNPWDDVLAAVICALLGV